MTVCFIYCAGYWYLYWYAEKDTPINELQNVAEKFVVRGDITSITQINKDYINRTYKVETLSDAGRVHKYTLGRIYDELGLEAHID